MNGKKGYLILENGDRYEGELFGCEKESVGELVFTTGMCGYIETITDPSYYGQIVVMTFPLIGNYGDISSDHEGRPALFGFVVREKCDEPSNFRCERTLDEFLKAEGIPGLCGIDTRSVTETVRERGTMNAAITGDPCFDVKKLKDYSVRNAVRSVTCGGVSVSEPEGPANYSVALIDYGAKGNIVRELTKRGCRVTVFPAGTEAGTVLSGGFDGLMLSNGPGDPAENTFEIEQIRKMLGKIPAFGICLGHQLMALASGASTGKLKYGHRGANQPVTATGTGRTYITTQNHGYEVIADTVKEGIVSYVNANDGSCEGVDYPEKHAFSVQFHPEACAGPHDTEFLFDRFIALMKEGIGHAEG